MPAAIIFLGLVGLGLVLRRKDVVTFVLGLALLAISAYLLVEHLEWLKG